MAKVTCAISGLDFQVSAFSDLNISYKVGYFHPIFAAPYRDLEKLYYKHTRGRLTPTDSYLLFLAYLNSSDQVHWDYPLTLNPKDPATRKLVENNFSQLVSVLQKTAVITYSSFDQPSFRVTYENSRLEEIQFWIEAWIENINSFSFNRATERDRSALLAVEKKLEILILSDLSPEAYSKTIADWASRAAIFPESKEELYKTTIASCFNITKMFNTPLALLKEIKNYCECNIEAGSIHFHALIKVLQEGISRHVDYLGGSALTLGYELLPSASISTQMLEADKKLKIIAETAPTELPLKEDYKSPIEYLKARLAFRVAANIAKNSIKKEGL